MSTVLLIFTPISSFPYGLYELVILTNFVQCPPQNSTVCAWYTFLFFKLNVRCTLPLIYNLFVPSKSILQCGSDNYWPYQSRTCFDFGLLKLIDINLRINFFRPLNRPSAYGILQRASQCVLWRTTRSLWGPWSFTPSWTCLHRHRRTTSRSGDAQMENSSRYAKCCVFQPANGCFACLLLAQIIFLGFLTPFFIFFRQKEDKNFKQRAKRGVVKTSHFLFSTSLFIYSNEVY